MHISILVALLTLGTEMLRPTILPFAQRANRVRTLIIEDARFDRECVEPFLRQQGDIEVVGIAVDISIALCVAHVAAPDVVVVNLCENSDVVRLLRELRWRLPLQRLLVILRRKEPTTTRSVLDAGADKLLFGNIRPGAVIEAIRLLGTAAHPDESSCS